MKKILAILMAAALVACAPSEPPQVSSDSQGRPIARIALVEAHPFDLKRLVEGKTPEYVAGFLRLVDAKDADATDTNYDQTKSLVTVVAGDYPEGGTLVLDFIQIAGKRSEYKVTSSFGPTSRGRPAIIINAFRIARSANMDVTAKIDGEIVAFKRFNAEGPPDEAQSGYPILAGDQQLSADEVRTEFIGRTFALENDGTSQFLTDGTIVRSRSRGTRKGPYEIRADGLTCINLQNDRERCYKIVRDVRGNLTIINDRARRYRMEPV